ncbi:MAG: GntR family transcriptional regulator, partial [Mycobacterium sp.]|nr:GntR family transcriptional regulator [Mycobacterium sp.]
GWGADAVDNHRRLIEALRARDVDAAVGHTTWQFTDGATRLTAVLDSSGIWDQD